MDEPPVEPPAQLTRIATPGVPTRRPSHGGVA